MTLATCVEKSPRNEISPFAHGRTRGQQIAVAVVLILTMCFAQRSTAEAATIQVNTTQQGVTSGQCSLQEAIYASEFKANKAIASTDPDTVYTTGCTAGTGNDMIVLPAGAVFTFDHFWEGDSQNIYGPTATPLIFSKITIEGNGATLQWLDSFRPGNSRLFVIAGAVDPRTIAAGTGNLTLRNVYIKGFHIKRGNGGPGGGGGLGAGGAIYVSGPGELTVENSTFENNGAVGGNGGADGVSGGGGGLSGDGGRGCSYSGGGGGGPRGNGGNGMPPDAVVVRRQEALAAAEPFIQAGRVQAMAVGEEGCAGAGMVGALGEMAMIRLVRAEAEGVAAAKASPSVVSLITATGMAPT
jgi:hypothetical protein